MKDMIDKILKMEEEARKLTEETQENLKKSEKKSNEYKIKIETEYLEKARERIKKNKIIENEASEKELNEYVKIQKNILKNLDSIYQKNAHIWVDEICARVLEE